MLSVILKTIGYAIICCFLLCFVCFFVKDKKNYNLVYDINKISSAMCKLNKHRNELKHITNVTFRSSFDEGYVKNSFAKGYVNFSDACTMNATYRLGGKIYPDFSEQFPHVTVNSSLIKDNIDFKFCRLYDLELFPIITAYKNNDDYIEIRNCTNTTMLFHLYKDSKSNIYVTHITKIPDIYKLYNKNYNCDKVDNFYNFQRFLKLIKKSAAATIIIILASIAYFSCLLYKIATYLGTLFI